MLLKSKHYCRPSKPQTIKNEIVLRCYKFNYMFVAILLGWLGLASSGVYELEVFPDSINLAEEDTLYIMCSCATIPNVNDYLLAWDFDAISAVEGLASTIPREWQVFGGYQSGEYDLQIPYITVNSAGVYVCKLLDSNQGVLESARVTVSVTPIVASNFPTCLLSRTGSLTVDMELDVVCAFKQTNFSGEQVELKQKTSSGLETLVMSSPTYTSSEYTINVKMRIYLTRGHNQAEFVCFASEGNLKYQTSCSFQPLEVSFRPYVELEPIFVLVSDQSAALTFTCSALDAYPVEVTFKWFLRDNLISTNSDRMSIKEISSLSNELTIYNVLSTDDGANVVCQIENAVGLSLATGRISLAVEEESSSDDTTTSLWYLVLIAGCIAAVCIISLILCIVYVKKKREKEQPNIYSASPLPPKQQVFTVDRRYAKRSRSQQRQISVGSRSSGSEYVTRAIRGELRETPSSTPKQRYSSVSTHPLTDSGHSSLMPSPEANNLSSTQHSRNVTPRGSNTSQHTKGNNRHVAKKSHQNHGHIRQHRYNKNTPADNRIRNHKTNATNVDSSAQQKIYKKRKTKSERDRIRNKSTGEPKRTPLQHAHFDTNNNQSNKARVPTNHRTETDGESTDGRTNQQARDIVLTPRNQPVARDIVPTLQNGSQQNQSPIAAEEDVFENQPLERAPCTSENTGHRTPSSSTIVYAEINHCTPRSEEPLIRNEDELQSVNHVVQINDE